MLYDSTLGYADHEGFRGGTCWSFRPFDIENDRVLDLWEVPLIVMDVTLRNYRGFTPTEAKVRILELAERVKRVGGTLTILWHNTSLYESWKDWGSMYFEVLKMISSAMPGSRVDPLETLHTLVDRSEV